MDKQQGSIQHRAYSQYPVKSHNRKDIKKEYICIAESLCCTAEINTTFKYKKKNPAKNLWPLP